MGAEHVRDCKIEFSIQFQNPAQLAQPLLNAINVFKSVEGYIGIEAAVLNW